MLYRLTSDPAKIISFTFEVEHVSGRRNLYELEVSHSCKLHVGFQTGCDARVYETEIQCEHRETLHACENRQGDFKEKGQNLQAN